MLNFDIPLRFAFPLPDIKVILPHIPKCAGSSLKKQLENDSRYFQDYNCHPTWQSNSDILSGKKKQRRIIKKLESRSSWIIHGHFASQAYYSLNFDYQILLLRQPLERAVSQFFYFKNILPKNKVSVRRHPEVLAIKSGVMEIGEFLLLDHVRYFYSRYYLENLLMDNRLIVLSVHDMASSLDAIGKLLNISFNPDIFVNQNSYTGDFRHLCSILDADTKLYEDLLKHPNTALQEHLLTTETV
jgi:hypothetical protein